MYTDSEPVHCGSVWHTDQGKPRSVQTFSPGINPVILPPLTDKSLLEKPLRRQRYAESLLRPFALRALITARPARVLILSRKPWVLLRFRILG
jgi:hypothetical protein